MALSRKVLEIFDVKEYNDLEIRIMVTQGHRKWYHSIACLWFPITIFSGGTRILEQVGPAAEPKLVW